MDKYCKFKNGARQHLNQVMLLVHIKESVREFLFQFQDENRNEMVQYGGEISSEVD